MGTYLIGAGHILGVNTMGFIKLRKTCPYLPTLKLDKLGQMERKLVNKNRVIPEFVIYYSLKDFLGEKVTINLFFSHFFGSKIETVKCHPLPLTVLGIM